MNIALLGYGKMGKEIETSAIGRGHSIVLKVDIENATSYTVDELKKADVAIEFSTPDTALNNIYKCFEAGVPVVVGTTGWLDSLAEVEAKCKETNQTLFYASNYSIGVNLFFKLNEYLAKMMNSFPDYKVTMKEIHHIHKLDSPSGTAISLADQVIKQMEDKTKWVNAPADNPGELYIESERIDEVPGTHTVSYSSFVDNISMTHKAHSREGFATGAVIAAEWSIGKKGVFGMNDLMG